jgi:hypothetical protein
LLETGKNPTELIDASAKKQLKKAELGIQLWE